MRVGTDSQHEYIYTYSRLVSRVIRFFAESSLARVQAKKQNFPGIEIRLDLSR